MLPNLLCRIILFTLALVPFTVTVNPAGAASSVPDDPTDYMIVVTGGELLRGVYADGHTLFLTRTLNPLGCRCVGSMSVGDSPEDLRAALEFAEQHAKLIIITGGLGPTDDDVTRKTLSKFTGVPLHMHPDAIKDLERRFGRPLDKIRENLQRQTLTPETGTYFNNPNGTAVGLLFDNGERVIAALPGPPGELQTMVTGELIPYLAKRFGIHSIGASLTMRFVNIGESNIDQTIHSKMQLPDDLIISSLFVQGRVDLTFAFPGSTPDDVARLKALESELLGHIREYFYADDGSTLEERVIQLLAERKATLVTAEVGSGGAIAASLHNAEGASSLYTGGCAAPTHRVLLEMLNGSAPLTYLPESSEKSIRTIAEQASKKSKNAWAIAISEIEIADDRSRHVWAAFGSKQSGFEVKRIRLRGNGRSAQDRLVTTVLDQVRRKLKKK